MRFFCIEALVTTQIRAEVSDTASMKQDFSKAAAWTAAASWVEQIAAALVFVIIARLIGVESFGVAAMAFAFLFLGEFLVRDTLTEAIIERRSLEEGRLEATFVVLLGFSVLVVVTLLIVAQIIAPIYDEPLVAPLLSLASPTILLVGLGGVSTALLRRRMQYKTLAIRTIVGMVAGGAVGVLMALNGFGAWSLVGQRIVEIGVNTVLAILGARWWPKRLPTRQELSLVRGLGVRVLELRFWTLVVAQTPTVMLGVFADARAVGLFAFSLRLIEIVLKISVRVIQGVAQSAIAALRRQGAATSQFFLDLIELSAFVGFLSFSGLALIAVPLTRVLLGTEWDAAGPIIPFLCVAGVAMSLTATQEAYLLALDQLDEFRRVIRLEALIGIPMIALAASLGAMGVAAVVALRALIFLPLCTHRALAPEGIAHRWFARALVSPAIAALAMATCLVVWRLFALGRIADVAYIALAVSIGLTVSVVVVVRFMPATLARLKSYVGA